MLIFHWMKASPALKKYLLLGERVEVKGASWKLYRGDSRWKS